MVVVRQQTVEHQNESKKTERESVWGCFFLSLSFFISQTRLVFFLPGGISYNSGLLLFIDELEWSVIGGGRTGADFGADELVRYPATPGLEVR